MLVAARTQTWAAEKKAQALQPRMGRTGLRCRFTFRPMGSRLPRGTENLPCLRHYSQPRCALRTPKRFLLRNTITSLFRLYNALLTSEPKVIPSDLVGQTRQAGWATQFPQTRLLVRLGITLSTDISI